jgi:hypothetical protein
LSDPSSVGSIDRCCGQYTSLEVSSLAVVVGCSPSLPGEWGQ